MLDHYFKGSWLAVLNLLALGVPAMKASSTTFLQFVIVICGIAVLAFLLWEPHLEGRNAVDVQLPW